MFVFISLYRPAQSGRQQPGSGYTTLKKSIPSQSITTYQWFPCTTEIVLSGHTNKDNTNGCALNGTYKGYHAMGMLC